MRIFLTTLTIVLHSICCSAQNENSVSIYFKPIYGENTFDLNKNIYIVKDQDSTKITNCKFYISNITLLNNENTIYKESDSYHLIDLSNNSSQKIILPVDRIKNYSILRFEIGIDSATNVAGALGGDLDATKGMYWAWHSGYINVKFEGVTNINKKPKKEFIYHIGGYKYPFNSIQNISFNVKSQQTHNIEIDFEKLLFQITEHDIYKIMSPQEAAIEIAKLFANNFQYK